MQDIFEIECDMNYTDQEKLKDVPKRASEYVTPEDWAEFVEWVTSPEFDLISERMRQRRNDQRNQTRVGRKGMTGCNDKHMEEGDEEPDRADSWMWARMNVACGFDDPDIQVIVDEILRLKARQKSGELILNDNEYIINNNRMTAVAAELIRLRRKVKEFEDGERAPGGKKFTPKKKSDAEEALAVSQKKVEELEKKLSDYYKSQEPYIPEYDHGDDQKKSAQDEKSDFEGDFDKTDNFKADQADLSSFFNPKLAKFSNSFPGKFIRGPYYPNEYLDTELMDDIFNERKIII
ncbi:hypothetical protein ACFE04_001550 [Oxalis oulophora]